MFGTHSRGRWPAALGRWRRPVIPACTLIGMLACGGPAMGAAGEYATVSSLFGRHCIVCHSGPQAVMGLRLDTHAGVIAGSERGPVVNPGDPEGSELVRRLLGVSQPRMPLTGPPFLSEAEVASIAAWIRDGAKSGPAGEHAPPAATRRELPKPGAAVVYGDVAPILLQRCAKCHSAQSILGAPPEGLRMTTLPELLRGGDRAVVVPGHPLASELYRRVAGLAQPRMPFDGPPYLSADEIRVLGDWIAQGARDEAGSPAPIPVGRSVRFTGTLTGQWAVDGMPLRVGGATRIDKAPRVGGRVEVRGVIAADGNVDVLRLRRR